MQFVDSSLIHKVAKFECKQQKNNNAKSSKFQSKLEVHHHEWLENGIQNIHTDQI